MFWGIIIFLATLLLLVPLFFSFYVQMCGLSLQTRGELRWFGMSVAYLSVEAGFLPGHIDTHLEIAGIPVPVRKVPRGKSAFKRKIRPRLAKLKASLRFGLSDDPALVALLYGGIQNLWALAVGYCSCAQKARLSLQPDFQQDCFSMEIHGILYLSLGQIILDEIQRRIGKHGRKGTSH